MTLMILLFSFNPVQAGVVLLYHHVDDGTPPITSISPAQFERHLDILEEEGYAVVPLPTLLEKSFTGAPRDKTVAITFDDAYQSIYHTAYPMLKARGMPFTIFVATDLVQDNHPLYLSWQQLREMADDGVIIANHTQSHAHLIRRLDGESPEEWRRRVTEEITLAGEDLAAHDMNAPYFAYPYGEYNLELLDILESIGMIGFGQQSGAIGPGSNRLVLPRFPLAGVYVGEAAFRDKIRSLPMPIEHPDIEPLTDDPRPELRLTFTAPQPVSRLTCYGPGGLMVGEPVSEDTVTVTPVDALSVGRNRYNCTLPAGQGRFYWFSQLWIQKQPDGSWYPEP